MSKIVKNNFEKLTITDLIFYGLLLLIVIVAMLLIFHVWF
jgi:hypothetical protein